MKKDDVLCKLGWTENYHKISTFAQQFISEDKAKNIITPTADPHVITERILKKDLPAELFRELPTIPQFIQIFAMPPFCLGMIHKDGLSRKAAINIPIKGCDAGEMNWFFDSAKLQQHTIDSTYTKVRLVEEEVKNKGSRLNINPEFIDTVEVPSVINTDVWHRLDNSKNSAFRWMLSMRFEDNPSFINLKNIFRNANAHD